MASNSLSFSKLKSLNDIDFNLVHIQKSNYASSYSRKVFEEMLKNKQHLITQFINSKKEYIFRINLGKEITALAQQEMCLSQKLLHLKKKLKSQYAKEEGAKDKNELKKKVAMYENNLALRIEPASDSSVSSDEVAFSFIFHNINENNPEETCSFILMITDKNIYKVTDCKPEITVMNELLSELNITNNLHKFIVDVRRNFCESLSTKRLITVI